MEATQAAVAIPVEVAAIPVVVAAATPAAVGMVATPAAVEATPEAAVATPEAVVATLEAAEVVTLEVAEAATLEEAEVVTLEEVAAATPEEEVARAMLATEVTNINRKKSSPRATTFDHVSLIINHHRMSQKRKNASTSSIPRSKHETNTRNPAKLYQSNGTSADGTRRNEAESEVILANMKSSPKHPESALKV
ncbi:hypothetical protein WN48_06631 [Eufriesea mexicana]|uniref:Uncharacterized protein n=1 Tax=Eufriesea mexicana TaxID=516756 RepID=A0A310ST44_9HYME|nr:hypothetical protein WN48_06631 [Eufriesea mexicana]